MISPIPNLATQHSGRIAEDRGETQEYFRTLLHRLPWVGNGAAEPLRTIGVTSCYAGEGVSTISTQLANIAASMTEHRILFVDFNVSDPSAQQIFNVNATPGLSEVLAGDSTLDQAIQSFAGSSLFVLAAGAMIPNLRRAYDSNDLRGLINDLNQQYDLVIYDLPAAGKESSTIGMAGLLDGILLVVEAERVRWEVAQQTKDVLTQAGANLLGAIFNKRQQHVPNWLYRTL